MRSITWLASVVVMAGLLVISLPLLVWVWWIDPPRDSPGCNGPPEGKG